jgi:hypothetical protein
MSRWKLEGEFVTVTKGKDKDDMSCTPLQFSMVIKNIINKINKGTFIAGKNVITCSCKGCRKLPCSPLHTCLTVQRKDCQRLKRNTNPLRAYVIQYSNSLSLSIEEFFYGLFAGYCAACNTSHRTLLASPVRNRENISNRRQPKISAS